MTSRHADDIYRKALLEIELTDGERQHARTCAECRTAVAEVAGLDDRLRFAAGPLADEPLPDGVLEDDLAGAIDGRLRVPGIVALGLGVVAVALTVGGLRLAAVGQSTPSPIAFSPEASPSFTLLPSPAPSVYPEVILYAEEFGVSLEEAIRRMEIMQGLTSIPLRQAVGNRWAGGWMEHAPEFRYVVRLTGDGAVDEFEALTADWPLPVVFIIGAEHSESEMLAAMARIDDRVHAEFPRMGMYPDTQTGNIVLEGPDEPTAEFLAEMETLGGVPVRYEYSAGYVEQL